MSPLEQPYSAQEVKRETANVKREETDTGYRMPDSGYRMPDARFLERLKMLLEQLPQEEEAVLGWLQSGNDYSNTESGELLSCTAAGYGGNAGGELVGGV